MKPLVYAAAFRRQHIGSVSRGGNLSCLDVYVSPAVFAVSRLVRKE